MSILILSFPGDGQTEMVEPILKKKNADYVLYDLNHYPQNAQISMSINARGEVRSFLETEDKRFCLNDFSAVWYRGEPLPKVIRFPKKEATRAYIEAESKTFLNGLPYFMPGAFWISHPHHVQAADIKPLQLQVAARLGFKIPHTAFGNDYTAAHTLLKEHGTFAIKATHRTMVDFDFTFLQQLSKIIYDFRNRKMLQEYQNQPRIHDALSYKFRKIIQTRHIPAGQAEACLSTISDCPVIVQEYLPKKLELRITVVGKQIFPCAIYSQDALTEEGKVDYRGSEHEMRHESHMLPEDIREKCFELLKALNLQLGCIDMVVTPSGEYVFLEINPLGEWGWVEDATGMPIAEAIADLLMLHEVTPCSRV